MHFYLFLYLLANIRLGLNGEACLQRTICELAESPLAHNGLFGKLVHLLMT